MPGPSPRKSDKTNQRVALAFFPGEGALAAYRTLRERRSLRGLVRPGTPSSKADAFGHLALPDESILSVNIDGADLSTIIDTLQAAGARSIFLTNGRLHSLEEETCLQFGKTSIRGGNIQNSIDSLQNSVRSSRDYLVDSVRLGHLASPAAQWVVDNAYLIALTLGELRKEIPAAFKTSQLQDVNALMASATQLVRQSDARITEDVLREFLDRAQQVEELDSARLWSFPLLLRAALIETLAQLACRASRNQQLREIAFLWADRLTAGATRSAALLEQMVARLRAESFAVTAVCGCTGGTTSGSGSGSRRRTSIYRSAVRDSFC